MLYLLNIHTPGYQLLPSRMMLHHYVKISIHDLYIFAVATRISVWIEILKIMESPACTMVATRISVWIEICMVIAFLCFGSLQLASV